MDQETYIGVRQYIDDIFFTWDYDETSLKHFINFCNNYSSNQSMKSNITFTADYSTSEVYFLDTKIKFKGERLISELYSKPTASFQYLHRTFYHPPHTFRSILKSQSYAFDAFVPTLMTTGSMLKDLALFLGHVVLNS